MFYKMGKRKNVDKSIEESSSSSTPTETKDNESPTEIKDNKFISFEESTSNDKNIIINKFHYFGNVNKSVFEIKNFKLTKENFLSWYNPLRRHLIALDYDTYIDKNIKSTEMSREQIKSDSAVQTIIINSLDESSKIYLKGCRTSFQMIERLQKRFYQSGQALLNALKLKMVNLKIIDNDYIQYINELNNLFDQYQNESEKLKITALDEETKLQYSIHELYKIGINSPPIYNFNTFDELVTELYKRHDFFEKANILKSSNNNIKEESVNNINKKQENNKTFNKTNIRENKEY